MGINRRQFISRAGALTAAGAGAAALGPGVRRGAAASSIAASECPIDTIVVLMMENRSFDNLLGRLPGADGLGRMMSNTNDHGDPIFVHRMRDFTATLADLAHSREGSLDQYNGAKNNNFVKQSGGQAMGYLHPDEAPWINEAARHFTVFDRWFCSLLGPTQPNRRYLHAGTSGGVTGNTDDLLEPPLGFPQRTVWDQLADAGVMWRDYFADLPGLALYFGLVLRHFDRFDGVARFYADAAAGKLPPVSFVEPGYFIGTDDHPPANIQAGQRFMADITRALMNSPQWFDPETGRGAALLITYDEHGGFYDHVAPPAMPDDHPELGRPIGFRVPSLLISPFARRGEVVSTTHDHTSATRFLQWRFGLPALTKRNDAAESILHAFDFANPDPTLPDLPVPKVDTALSSLTRWSIVVGPHGHHFDMPGGEGPEPERLWVGNGAEVRSGVAVASPEEAKSAPKLVDPDHGVISPNGQPELAAAADSGLIPAELDLRPDTAAAEPKLFLEDGDLPDSPAWQTQHTTATRDAASDPRVPGLGRLRHGNRFPR